jgi:hypothetical protein
MRNESGVRLDLYLRKGQADIQAQPYQAGYVLKFQWEDEASAINLYLSSEQAHDLVRRLSGVFASESEGAT